MDLFNLVFDPGNWVQGSGVACRGSGRAGPDLHYARCLDKMGALLCECLAQGLRAECSDDASGAGALVWLALAVALALLARATAEDDSDSDSDDETKKRMYS